MLSLSIEVPHGAYVYPVALRNLLANIYMLKQIFRVLASMVVVVGLLLLVKTLYHGFTGTLSDQLFPQSDGALIWSVYALGLSLPVPLHVIFVGLIVQKRWLSPRWATFAWIGVAASGCWLGVALGIKLLVLG
ncbi:MAG: hypothetical protein ACE5G0_08255 [Rhodothermales bacterium]